jgi:hypothetical protein
MSQPTLLPGLRRLWRDHHNLQVGTDPGRAVILEFPDPAVARILDLLDGSHSEREVVRAAADLGLEEQAVTDVLATLRGAGLVVGARALLPAGLAEPSRRQLATELASLALTGAGRPADALRRRAAARVVVQGHGRLAAPIAAALAGSGVGHVEPALSGRARLDEAAMGGMLPADAGRPRATATADAVTRMAPAADTRALRQTPPSFVVQAGLTRPAGLAALSFARRRVPHLAVDVRDGIALVGPLVAAPGTPCLNCVDLHRQDRDPVWPALAAQLSTGPEQAIPCSLTTALLATGYVVEDVLAFIDGRSPQTVGTTIEILGAGRERRRRWSAHPRCDCSRFRRSR